MTFRKRALGTVKGFKWGKLTVDMSGYNSKLMLAYNFASFAEQAMCGIGSKSILAEIVDTSGTCSSVHEGQHTGKEDYGYGLSFIPVSS